MPTCQNDPVKIENMVCIGRLYESLDHSRKGLQCFIGPILSFADKIVRNRAVKISPSTLKVSVTFQASGKESFNTMLGNYLWLTATGCPPLIYVRVNRTISIP